MDHPIPNIFRETPPEVRRYLIHVVKGGSWKVIENTDGTYRLSCIVGEPSYLPETEEQKKDILDSAYARRKEPIDCDCAMCAGM